MKIVRRTLHRAGFAAALMAMSCSAFANFTCTGKVAYLGLSPSGLVVLSVGFGVWVMCDQTTAFAGNGGTFTPEGCRAWYAAMLAAQKSDQSVQLFFASAATTNNGAECSALGSWVTPNPSPYHISALSQ
jgi:hypothetical protein